MCGLDEALRMIRQLAVLEGLFSRRQTQDMATDAGLTSGKDAVCFAVMPPDIG